MKRTVAFILGVLFLSIVLPAMAAEPINIGDRRELFIDDYLIDSMDRVGLVMHEPQRQNVAIKFDKPWEWAGVSYVAIIHEKDKYRLYYDVWKPQGPLHKIMYAESVDGVTFTRPNLGLVEAPETGTRDNNIVLRSILGHHGVGDFSPFLDTNPKATADGKYKGVSGGHYCTLKALKSPDGIHWSVIGDKPLKLAGFFDTQNVAFWSEHEQKYVLYYRVGGDDEGNMYSQSPARDAKHGLQQRDVWKEDTHLNRVAVMKRGEGYPPKDPNTGEILSYRHVARAVSDDFVNWKREGLIKFPNGGGPTKEGQFYTNGIRSYYRAPHIYIGFPGRFTDRGVTASTYELPQPEFRKTQPGRRGTAVTDSVLIHSRDGINFHQHDGVFLRPGLRRKYNWYYHDNFIAWHPVETPAAGDDAYPELAIYASEGFWSGKTWSRLVRYTLRIDGFVSAKAKTEQGELLTKPFTFDGKRLSLNVATSGFGWVKVELQDAQGKPIEGYTLEDADIIYGDTLDRKVSWKGKSDVSKLVGKPIRMRFVMREADLYSLKFEQN